MGRKSKVLIIGMMVALASVTATAPVSAASHHSPAAARRAALDAEMGNDLAHNELYDRYASAQYKDCLDKSEGVTVAMRDCSNAEYERLDRLLNEAYRQKMAGLPPARQTALRDLERTWLQRRRAYCEGYFTPGGGTEELLSFDSCYLNTTIHRTLFIRRFK